MAKKIRKYGIGGILQNYGTPQQAGSLTGGAWAGSSAMIFEDGGTLDSKIDKLEGKTLYIFQLGVKEPMAFQIKKAELDSPRFSKRGLKLMFHSAGEEKIKAEDVKAFLSGEAIEMKDDKEPYLISLKKNYDLGGIVQRFSSASLLKFSPSTVNEVGNFFEEGGKMPASSTIEVGDYVKAKKGTASGIVYKKLGSFIYLKDKYGTESQTLHEEAKFKKAQMPKYAQGGYTKRFSNDMLYKIREKQKHDRLDTEGVGNFELPKDRNTRYLYQLDDFDEQLVQGMKLKPNEHIFRYESETTKVGKFNPLVKINLDNQLVYFLTDEAMESGDIKFERKGVKAKFINISDKYAQGGNVPVHIKDEGVSFDEDMYSGILSDFDMDGLPNADDPNPFEGQDATSVEQMKFSKTFKNILETKQELNDDLNEFIGKLKINVPSQSKIYGRTKTPFSILNKLVSTRLLDEKKGLQDLVGTTVTFEDYEDLEDFKNKAKRGLYGKVVDYDDYYADPKDGYRAFHFVIEQNGVPIELQLKTNRMKDVNVLSHDAYKNKKLNKDYMLYLTTLADNADKGNKTAQNEFSRLMSNKSQVEKQLNN